MNLAGHTVPLAALNPRLYGPDWATVDTIEAAMGVQFDCPGCALAERKNHRIAMNFKGKGDPKRLWWNQTGLSLADLTFIDDPDGVHTRSLRVLGDGKSLCRSHFNITGGVIDFYPDARSP